MDAFKTSGIRMQGNMIAYICIKPQRPLYFLLKQASIVYISWHRK